MKERQSRSRQPRFSKPHTCSYATPVSIHFELLRVCHNSKFTSLKLNHLFHPAKEMTPPTANTTPLVLAFSPRSKLSLALESFKDSRRRSSGLRTGLEEEEELELKFEEDFGAGSTLVGEGREVSE